MNLFRNALQTALQNDACRDGDLIYFGPAERYVPIRWLERMADHEWECAETGRCTNPSASTYRCRQGLWAGKHRACDALMLDSELVWFRLAEIEKALA